MTDPSKPDPRFVERDGVQIHYSVQGTGPALILLHGGGPGATGADNYSRNITALAKTHTTYVIDFPGWGRSSKTLGALGARSPVMNGGRAVKLFMDALAIPKAHLVGNSFGGAAAFYMALDHPERVDRIITMAPSGAYLETQGPTPGMVRMMNYYAGEGPTRDKLEAFLQTLVHDYASITPEFIDERLAASRDPETVANPPLRALGGGRPPREFYLSEDPRLIALPHRCLMFWGLQDQVGLPTGVQPFAVVPNQDVVLLADCGHWVQWEQADKFNALANWFLDRP